MRADINLGMDLKDPVCSEKLTSTTFLEAPVCCNPSLPPFTPIFSLRLLTLSELSDVEICAPPAKTIHLDQR